MRRKDVKRVKAARKRADRAVEKFYKAIDGVRDHYFTMLSEIDDLVVAVEASDEEED